MKLVIITLMALSTLVHAQEKINWPAKCPEAPSKYAMPPNIKDSCLNFATDYYYRLRFTKETLTFRGGNNEQSYDRPQFSTEGALFLLALAQIESGWGAQGAVTHNNFWGLHGHSASELSQFNTFETGMAFYFNHLERGISGAAVKLKGHDGWPRFLELMTKTDITSDQINDSLNSGPYCTKFPAYNTGKEPRCEKEPKCPCVDYAGIIRKNSVTNVLSYCLKVFEEFEKRPEEKRVLKSAIYPHVRIPQVSSLPDPAERLRIVHKEFEEYAKKACGISSEPSTSAIDSAKLLPVLIDTVKGVGLSPGEVPPVCN